MARAPRLSLPADRRTGVLVALGLLALIGMAWGVLRLLPVNARGTSTAGVPRLVFAAFGQTADLIYVAPATRPDERTVIDTVPHAEGWGINPGPMYRDLVVFNAIPSGTPGQRGAPADLWLLNAGTRERTRLARDADLLVKPQFTPDGRAVLYRRSDGELQSIVRVDLETQARTVLYEERTAFGILPVGTDRGGALLFARLSTTGTDVFRKPTSGDPKLAFHASDELARDWQVSPDGRSIAFLAQQTIGERVVYRAQVAMIEEGRALELPEPGPGEQYGPVWTPNGHDLTVGQEPVAGDSAPVALISPEAAPTALVAPKQGFDVPFAWSANGTYLAARTFDGKNSTNAGRETAVVIARSGERYPVSAPGEVILVGWLPNA
jgi:dipeptidyl aminopeptidase/acylaminoacyl peptidase